MYFNKSMSPFSVLVRLSLTGVQVFANTIKRCKCLYVDIHAHKQIASQPLHKYNGIQNIVAFHAIVHAFFVFCTAWAA